MDNLFTVLVPSPTRNKSSLIHPGHNEDVHLALSPLDIHAVGELRTGLIGGEQTGGLARAQECDVGVDVEHGARAARRPDSDIDVIVLCVVAGERAGEGESIGDLFGTLVFQILMERARRRLT